MSQPDTDSDERREAAERVGVGIAFAIGVPLLALLAVLLFDISQGLRLGLFAGAAALGSFGLGAALLNLGDYRGNPAFGDWGVGIILGGIGGVLVALPALEVLGGVLGTVVTVVGFVVLLMAMIGGGIEAGKWFAAPLPRSSGTGSAGEPRSEPGALPTSRRERLGLLLAFLEVVGTFAGVLAPGSAAQASLRDPAGIPSIPWFAARFGPSSRDGHEDIPPRPAREARPPAGERHEQGGREAWPRPCHFLWRAEVDVRQDEYSAGIE